MEKHLETYYAIEHEFENFKKLWTTLGEPKYSDVRAKYLKNYGQGMFRINDLLHCSTFGHDALKSLCDRFYWSGIFKKMTLTSNFGDKHYYVINKERQYENLKQLKDSLGQVTLDNFNNSKLISNTHVTNLMKAIDELKSKAV